MDCTDAYRAALTRDFQATGAPAPAPGEPRPGAAEAGVTGSGAAVEPGTGPDGDSTQR